MDGDTEQAVIRAMCASDLSEVLAIEREVYAFPWPRQAFGNCVRLGYHCVLACRPSLALEEQVCGYAVMEVGPWEAHICNVSVGRAHQRRGIGRLLMRSLLDVARIRGAQSAYLEVRASNHAAQAFYSMLGFRQVGVRRDYYQAPVGVEDAYIWKRGINQSTL